MPRFQLNRLIWEIVLEDTSIVITEAKQTERRKFVTPEHARAQYEKAIAAKIALGFRELTIGTKPPKAKKPTGMADVFLVPDDLDALEVHSDALLTQDHFAGELLALQLSIHRLDPSRENVERRATFAARSQAILQKNRRAIFGDLGPFVQSVTAGGVAMSTPKARSSRAPCVATWRLGCIDDVRVEGAGELSVPQAIAALAKIPAARHLRSIVCGLPEVLPREGATEISYHATVAALRQHAPAFPRLTSIFLGNVPYTYTHAVRLGDLSELLLALPRLARLRLHGNGLTLAGQVPPSLRELEVVGPSATIANLRDVAARAPDLATVKLTPLRGYGLALEGVPDEDVFEVVARFASLTTLGLKHWGGPLVEPLLALPTLPRLASVDLSCNPSLSEDVDLLVRRAASLAHLTHLDLRHSSLREADVKRIEKALPRARASDQSSVLTTIDAVVGRHVTPDRRTRDSDDDDRYDGVRE
jgi:hypothetical protein